MVELSDFTLSDEVKRLNGLSVQEIPKHSTVKKNLTVANKETEADFASWLEDMLHLKGYKYAHFRPARVMRHGKEIYETPVSGDAAGLEDYFVWHEIKKVSFWAEIKSETGELSGKQKSIIASHRRAGLTVYLWFPSDRETIMEILDK